MSFSATSMTALKSSILALAAVLLLSACATTSEPQPRRVRSVIADGLDIGAMANVYDHAFKEIKERALDDPSMDAVFVDAINGLQKVDPLVHATAENDRVDVFYADIPLSPVTPLPRDNIPAWTRALITTILEARKLSAPMKDADAEHFYHASLNGALNKLDPYSRYAGRQDAARNRLVRDGVIGLGVRVVAVSEGVQVQAIVQEGPAEIAGVRMNDVITHADGVKLASMPLDEVRKFLDGASDTLVQLTLARPEHKDPLIVIARRDLIVPDTVTGQLIDGIAEVRVRSFNQRTAHAVERVVTLARTANGGQLKGVVLDLRGDPGGLFDQAVDMADMFLDSGSIVALRGRHSGAQQFYSAHRGDIAMGAPIAVVLDGRAASASEIVAAALQDNRRAAVVGTVSLGKGSVQTVIRLPNQGEIALTWSRSYTPRGAALHGLGVLPDVCLSGEDPLADGIARIFSGMNIPAEVRRDWREPPAEAGALEILRAACPAEPHPERTAELEVARRLIADPVLFAQAIHGEANQLAVKP